MADKNCGIPTTVPITPVFFQKSFAKNTDLCYNCFNNLIVEANAALFASVGLLISYYRQKKEKKLFKKLLFLSFIILFGYAAGICLAKYSGGDGSEAAPYRISDANDMNDIGLHEEDWDSHFVMVNDVNLAQFTGTQFNIIGYFIDFGHNNPFAGVFDGNGHTISNFSYQTTATDVIGLFGYVDDVNAVIKDLGLIDPNFDGGTSYHVGSLVGYLRSGTISGCYVKGGSVSANYVVGGLVGYVGGLVNVPLISRCYAECTVLGLMDAGGLVGGNETGMISNCYARGNVSGNKRVGGLVGFNVMWNATIQNCYATGAVDGNNYTGGLVGDNYLGTILSSGWDVQTGGPDNGLGTPLTTDQMQKETTFTSADWDFIEIWNIGENQTYPFLRLYPVGDSNHNGRVDGRDLAIISDRWLYGI